MCEWISLFKAKFSSQKMGVEKMGATVWAMGFFGVIFAVPCRTSKALLSLRILQWMSSLAVQLDETNRFLLTLDSSWNDF